MQQENMSITNSICIQGEICSDFSFSHQVYGEGFYSFNVKVKRLSENYDILPVTISERLLANETFNTGQKVEIEGQIRSYNSFVEEDKKNKLILTVFVKNIKIINEIVEKNINRIFLEGYICKKPTYRTTPFGREIADLLLAVNRTYNKSDYIPCISWGRNARFVEKLDVGTKIKIYGRLQSRTYQKKINELTILEKTAYEISVSKLELFEDNEI